MIYVILTREHGLHCAVREHGLYCAIRSQNMAAFILGSFLSAIGKASWYREWAMDPHQTDTGNNATLLKKENGKVTIKMEWRHQEADPSFITTVDKFISIIDQWEKLCAEKPSEIVVYKEGDDFILKARNLDDKNMEYTVLQKSDGYYSNVSSYHASHFSFFIHRLIDSLTNWQIKIFLFDHLMKRLYGINTLGQNINHALKFSKRLTLA